MDEVQLIIIKILARSLLLLYSGKSVMMFEEWKKVLIENCYIKVESISGTKDLIKIQVSLTASTLKSKKSYEFTPSMDGGNFIKQAYEHLKTLPDFDGAMDC